jgi:hypothetical protein
LLGRHEAELERIRIQNTKANIEASYNLKREYNHGSLQVNKQKSITEDYTMFDEHEDAEEEPLGMVIEEEEDSGEDEESDNGKDEEREIRAREKEELRNIKTQLLTVKEQLADKSARIDKIKDTLAISAVTYNFDQVQENLGTEEDPLDSSREDILSSDEMSDDQF